eukprot:1139454-Pelagomonas_calceolata.AAC.2
MSAGAWAAAAMETAGQMEGLRRRKGVALEEVQVQQEQRGDIGQGAGAAAGVAASKTWAASPQPRSGLLWMQCHTSMACSIRKTQHLDSFCELRMRTPCAGSAAHTLQSLHTGSVHAGLICCFPHPYLVHADPELNSSVQLHPLPIPVWTFYLVQRLQL